MSDETNDNPTLPRTTRERVKAGQPATPKKAKRSYAAEAQGLRNELNAVRERNCTARQLLEEAGQEGINGEAMRVLIRMAAKLLEE